MGKRLIIFYKVLFVAVVILGNGNSLTCAEIPIVISEFKAFHQSGQTFLAWQASGHLSGNSIYQAKGVESDGMFQKDYKQLFMQLENEEKSGNILRYRIYRSESPFKKTDIIQKNLIGEVRPLSVYYPYLYGMGWQEDRYSTRKIPRLAISDGKMLSHNSEIFVVNCKKAGKAYYAVVPSINGNNQLILDDNYLKSPIEEKEDSPAPVFQWKKAVVKNEYCYNATAGTVHYYTTWVDDPYSNSPQRFLWSIAVPDNYKNETPSALQLSLHPWGGNLDCTTYWYDVKPSTIKIATVNYPIQDWWYGYREKFGISKEPEHKEFVQNYTEKRLLSFIDWVKKKWNIDDNLIFAEGSSMGGSGAMHLGMKHGEQFAYLNSWVGIGSWRYSNYYRKGERSKWGEIEELDNFNHLKFDDWMDLSWWLRNNISKETPFLSFANGKNDTGIGWEQSIRTLEALIETKRPFVFLWGMAGHGERAKFMMDPEMMRTDRSLPAFRNCSFDDDPGTGTKLPNPKEFATPLGKILLDHYNGDSKGSINAYLRWQVILDTPEKYEIRLMVSSDAAQEQCTVDMTPRRLQGFMPTPKEIVLWQNIDKTGKAVQSGMVSPDPHNLLTLENLIVSKAGNRIILSKK